MPTTYTDNTGREYTLALTLGKARQLRANTGIDVTNPQDVPNIINSLATRLVMVWWLVADQCQQYGLDMDRFEEALQGDGVADNVGDALLAELADFTQRYGQKAVAVTLTETLSVMKMQREKMNSPEQIEAIQRKMEEVAAGLTSL